MNISKARILFVSAAIIFYAGTSFPAAQEAYRQNMPVEFVKFDGMAEKAGGLALGGEFRQEQGKPLLVIECESASGIHLYGSERALLREDASGGMALRHVGRMTFDINMAEEGIYRLYLRVWNASQLSGPAHTRINGAYIPALERPAGEPGEWGWFRSEPFALKAGANRININGDSIFWSAVLDRIVVAGVDVPGPEGAGPPVTAYAVDSGFAETGFFKPESIENWVSLSTSEVSSDGAITWFARQKETEEFSIIDIADLSRLNKDLPLQLRLQITKNSDGSSPWVELPEVSFTGRRRSVSLSEGVLFSEDPDGGCTVTTDNYTVNFAPDGRIASLKTGVHDVIVPLEDGKGGGWFQERGNNRLHEIGRPRLTRTGSVISRSDTCAFLWNFNDTTITLDAVTIVDGEFKMQVSGDAERIIDARTGNETTGISQGDPQIFFQGGANALFDDGWTYGGKYGVRLRQPNPEEPPVLAIWLNVANPWHKRFVLHVKPSYGDALEISVESPRKDFVFPGNEKIDIAYPVRMLFGMEFNAKAELSVSQLYASPPAAQASFTQEMRLTSENSNIGWSVNLPEPGLYRTNLKIYDGETLVHDKMSMNIIYGMDIVAPPYKPADFDKFWAETDRRIREMPLEFEMKKMSEDAKTNCIFCHITR